MSDDHVFVYVSPQQRYKINNGRAPGEGLRYCRRQCALVRTGENESSVRLTVLVDKSLHMGKNPRNGLNLVNYHRRCRFQVALEICTVNLLALPPATSPSHAGRARAANLPAQRSHCLYRRRCKFQVLLEICTAFLSFSPFHHVQNLAALDGGPHLQPTAMFFTLS